MTNERKEVKINVEELRNNQNTEVVEAEGEEVKIEGGKEE